MIGDQYNWKHPLLPCRLELNCFCLCSIITTMVLLHWSASHFCKSIDRLCEYNLYNTGQCIIFHNFSKIILLRNKEMIITQPIWHYIYLQSFIHIQRQKLQKLRTCQLRPISLDWRVDIIHFDWWWSGGWKVHFPFWQFFLSLPNEFKARVMLVVLSEKKKKIDI